MSFYILLFVYLSEKIIQLYNLIEYVILYSFDSSLIIFSTLIDFKEIRLIIKLVISLSIFASMNLKIIEAN